MMIIIIIIGIMVIIIVVLVVVVAAIRRRYLPHSPGKGLRRMPCGRAVSFRWTTRRFASTKSSTSVGPGLGF